MSIENLTNPGQPPVDGDRCRLTKPSGNTVTYTHSTVPVRPPRPAPDVYEIYTPDAFIEALPAAVEDQVIDAINAGTPVAVARWWRRVWIAGYVDFIHLDFGQHILGESMSKSSKSSKSSVSGVITQIRTTNIEESIEFYTRLGFELDFRFKDFYAGIKSQISNFI